jgi:integrase
VDLVNGWLRLEPGETKSGEGRQFPLTDELRTILEHQLASTRELEVARGVVIPWLFHRAGRRIRNFRRAWMTACKGAGVPGKIPHDFRRTAVRNLERAGVPRSAAMAMLRDGAGRLAALHQHEAAWLKQRLESEPGSRSAGVVVPLVKESVKAHAGRRRE